MLINPFKAAPPIKVMINIGACLDIPTGTYVTGRHGESILNGGLGFLTGVVGIGNNFKSTVMHYMSFTAMSRIVGSMGNTYDTEINIHEWHLKRMIANIEEFGGEDILESGRWTITDKTVYQGDQYFDILKEFMNDKKKNAAKYTVKTPFWNREKTGNLEITMPSFSEIDSLSEFVTQDVIKMQDENSLGESGANTVSMRQGLQKNRFLMEIPALSGGTYSYTLMTAHIGSEFNMDPRAPAPKKLQHIPQGVKLKGVPEKFTFVMNNCWLCYNAAPLRNDTTKAPEYPRDSDDDLKGDTDLNEVTIRQLRSKSGPSGMAMKLIVSQQDGVLPSLTEFHYIKSTDRYGIEGTLQNYYLSLLPDIKLSRTTVRRKIDAHPELRRALNITSEMCQINDLWHHIPEELLCTPKQLYDDLIALGYDWKILLNTRGWWALEDTNSTPFLSTMDLLKMRVGQYIPYWFTEEQRSKIKSPATKPLVVEQISTETTGVVIVK